MTALLLINIFLLFTLLSSVMLVSRRSALNLGTAFCLNLTLYFIGSLILYIQNFPRSDFLLHLSGVALFSGFVGQTFCYYLGFRTKLFNDLGAWHVTQCKAGPLERFIIFFGLLFSNAVCVLFVYTVFSSSIATVLLSVAALASDTVFLDLRKSITSGAYGYFAPGFVKQFRDILVPIFLMAVMLLHQKNVCPRHQTIFAIISAFLALLAMVVAGVRSNLVVLFLSLLLMWFLLKRYEPGMRQRLSFNLLGKVFAAGIGVFAVFSLLTVMLGRVSVDGNIIQTVTSSFLGLAERMVVAAPHENLVTLPFWISVGPTGGASWIDELSSVIPGAKGTGLSNQLHSYAGGSALGNSPLGTAADLWFAFGWWGAVFGPALAVIFLCGLDSGLAGSRSVILVAARAYLFVALLKIYSPFGFVLYGGLAVLILYFVITVIRANRAHIVSAIGDRQNA